MKVNTLWLWLALLRTSALFLAASISVRIMLALCLWLIADMVFQTIMEKSK